MTESNKNNCVLTKHAEPASGFARPQELADT